MRRHRLIFLEIEIEVGQGHRIGDRAALAHGDAETRSGQIEGLGRERASGVYQITQLLPPQGEAFQYRIKNVKEPHERIAKEYELLVRDLLRQS